MCHRVEKGMSGLEKKLHEERLRQMKLFKERLEAMNRKLEGANDNIDASVATSSKQLIIVSGDISDVDGFYGLAKYAQIGADVLFVMNYPAYLSETIEYNAPCTENELGLGYTYGLKAVKDITRDKYSSDEKFAAYQRLLDSCSQSSHNPKQIFKTALDRMAFFMANKVWDESQSTVPKGKLYYCSGDCNSINPFHVNIIKNELFVYASLLEANGYFDSDRLPTTAMSYILSSPNNMTTLSGLLYTYKSIYLDFSGSMAFYNSTWQRSISQCQNQIKACVVMGGVQSNAEPKTQPSIQNSLNRLSCATMNQLYHPSNTKLFFDFLKTNKVDTYVVSNNTAHDLATKGADNSPTDNGWKKFIRNNNIYTPFLEIIASAYYNSLYRPPRKAFDYYSALVLATLVQNRQVSCLPKQLWYDNTLGVSFISACANFQSVLEQYQWNVGDLQNDASSDTFAEKRKRSFIQEFAALTRIRTTNVCALSILDVRFSLDAANNELFIIQS
jgi:hypothetical protein